MISVAMKLARSASRSELAKSHDFLPSAKIGSTTGELRDSFIRCKRQAAAVQAA